MRKVVSRQGLMGMVQLFGKMDSISSMFHIKLYQNRISIKSYMYKVEPVIRIANQAQREKGGGILIIFSHLNELAISAFNNFLWYLQLLEILPVILIILHNQQIHIQSFEFQRYSKERPNKG